jgi:hypothetical protein
VSLNNKKGVKQNKPISKYFRKFHSLFTLYKQHTHTHTHTHREREINMKWGGVSIKNQKSNKIPLRLAIKSTSSTKSCLDNRPPTRFELLLLLMLAVLLLLLVLVAVVSLVFNDAIICIVSFSCRSGFVTCFEVIMNFALALHINTYWLRHLGLTIHHNIIIAICVVNE